MPNLVYTHTYEYFSVCVCACVIFSEEFVGKFIFKRIRGHLFIHSAMVASISI